jgi:hypothetical protein
VNRRKKAKSGRAAAGRKQYAFFAQLSFLQLVTTNKETSNNFQGAESSEEVSTTNPVETDQRVAHISPRKRKQNRLLPGQKLYKALTEVLN